jgi:hypothetical protein
MSPQILALDGAVSNLIASSSSVINSTNPSNRYSPNSTKTVETNPPNISSSLNSLNKLVARADTFSLKYTDKNGDKKIDFTLLPAIETVLNYSSPTSKFRGGPGVPEVQPGIPIRTQMRVKNHLVPGSNYMLQNLSIDRKSIFLVGAIIPGKTSSNTYETANFIEENIVRRGAIITVSIKVPSRNFTESVFFTGSILEFKYYCVRNNLTYYSLSILYFSSNFNKANYTQLSFDTTTNQLTPTEIGVKVTPAAVAAATATATTPVATNPNNQSNPFFGSATAAEPPNTNNTPLPPITPGPDYGDQLALRLPSIPQGVRQYNTRNQASINELSNARAFIAAAGVTKRTSYTTALQNLVQKCKTFFYSENYLNTNGTHFFIFIRTDKGKRGNEPNVYLKIITSGTGHSTKLKQIEYINKLDNSRVNLL